MMPASQPANGREELAALLQDLISRFNEKDLPRALLRDVGTVLINELAPPHEAKLLAEQWQHRWRQAVWMEQQPMRKFG